MVDDEPDLTNVDLDAFVPEVDELKSLKALGKPKKPRKKGAAVAAPPEQESVVESSPEQPTLLSRPSMQSPGWLPYLFLLIEPSERINDVITVFGLRRLARLLLGPIISSRPAGIHRSGLFGDTVTVEYEVSILWTVPEDIPEGGASYQVVYGGVGEASPLNTTADEGRNPVVVATERAERNALLRALSLEGEALPPLRFKGTEELISEEQVTWLRVVCERANINVKKLMNINSEKDGKVYEDPLTFPAYRAERMCYYITKLVNDMSLIGEDITGYDPEWWKREAN